MDHSSIQSNFNSLLDQERLSSSSVLTLRELSNFPLFPYLPLLSQNLGQKIRITLGRRVAAITTEGLDRLPKI